MNKEVTLPSGAKLIITLAPFADARALYQAVLEELKSVQLNPSENIDVNLFKDLACVAFSSKKIESCLNVCMKRATYNGLRIDENTFEPVEARADYLQVCIEVTKENILPFMKSLYAQYSQILEILKTPPA